MPRKQMLFLDIDGTVTNTSGGTMIEINGVKHYCLFGTYQGSNQFDLTDIQRYFCLSDGTNVSHLVIDFLKRVQDKEIEIIPVTNNYRDTTIRLLELLGVPEPERGLYREVPLTKKKFINQIVEVEPDADYFYLEDTLSYFEDIDEKVITIDCSNGNWIGKQLYEQSNDFLESI